MATSRALGYSIFTEAADLDALRDAVRDAVRCHFEDPARPKVIRLHFVRGKSSRDEIAARSVRTRPRQGFGQARLRDHPSDQCHVRLTTQRNGEHHVTIPDHHPIRVGTLAGILADVAHHHGLTRDGVTRLLFDRK